jgi:hypothetical protein
MRFSRPELWGWVEGHGELPPIDRQDEGAPQRCARPLDSVPAWTQNPTPVIQYTDDTLIVLLACPSQL